MAKLDRKDVKIFAENSKETLITEFRTEDSEGNTASFSRDPDVIQNENYSQGWVNDTNNLNTKIYGEDLNAVNYVLSYLLKYLYENGIAEWKSTTTYYQNSICKVDNALYLSLQNNNTGNDPTSTVSYWKLIPLENVSIEDAGSGFSIVKDVTDNVITFKTISVTGYGEITDNGDQLNIDIAGGGGGGSGDAYWGTIRGTITNQTDLMALINLKQDIFTVDAPLVLTDEQHLTINKATASVSGYLDYNDFNTFNGKQDALTGFTHSYDADNDEATIESSASISNIGSNSNPISNVTANNITGTSVSTSNATVSTKLQVDTIARNNGTAITVGDTLKVDGNVYTNKLIAYDASTGYIEFQANQNQYRCESGKTHKFVMGNTTIASIGYLDSNTNGLIMSGAIRASSNETYNIGSGGFRFNNLFTKQIGNGSQYTDMAFIDSAYVATLNTKPGTSGITLNGELIGGGSTSASLGTTTNPIDALYVNYAHINNGRFSYLKTNEIVYSGNNGAKLNIDYNDISPSEDNAYHLGYHTSFRRINCYDFHVSSDINKKEEINEYNVSVLGKLEKINPIIYNFKDNKDETRLGISAQELREQEPLIVDSQIEETKDGKEEKNIGIDLYGLVVFSLKAIKELNEKVKTLEARIEEIEK